MTPPATNVPAGAPSATPAAVPPGIKPEYNHDLNVSAEFRRGYPRIADCLIDQRLFTAFQAYDKEAKRTKWWFETLGFWSLLLGTFPLLVAATRMTFGETRFTGIAALGTVGDFCAAAAVVLVIWMRSRRLRARWCVAVFCREELRLWQFQKFLDGELISQCQSQPAAFQASLDKRWDILQQQFRDAYGMMTRFAGAASEDDDLFHKPTSYTDTAAAAEVFDALTVLRFDHQLSYSGRKIQPESVEPGLGLSERTSVSETVATATFGGAVLVTAIAFVISVGPMIPGVGAVLVPGWTGRAFAGVSLFLAVLSAASRAYRAGFTLPDEAESYEEYCDRVREIKVAFKTAASEHEKLRQLTHLEREAAGELRRFLRMKMRATFVS